MKSIEGGGFQRLRNRLSGILKRSNLTIQDSSPEEKMLEKPFNRLDYCYMRDSLYQLQAGRKITKDGVVDVALPDESPGASSLIGGSGYWIGEKTILGLREGRLNSDENQYVLCVDKLSDEQVLKDAAEEEIKKFYIEAVGAGQKALRLSSVKGKDAYIASAVALASVLFNLNSAQSFKMVEEALSLERSSLQHLSQERFKGLVRFLKSSKQRSIEEESDGALPYGGREIKTDVESSLKVDEREWQTTGAGKISVKIKLKEPLVIKEPLIIKAFRRVVYKSRQAMATQALLFANTYLGATEDSLREVRPPKSFTDYDGIEGLRSDEILIFFPTSLPGQIQKKEHVPDFIKQLYDLGVNEGGWYKLKISIGNDKITQVEWVS